MSIYCIAKCLHARTKLKARDKLVLLALCERADDDGGNAWPSVATLARYAECSTRNGYSRRWSGTGGFVSRRNRRGSGLVSMRSSLRGSAEG